jgi:putative endopeptidase
MKKQIILASAALLVGGAFVYKEANKGVDLKSMNKKANPRDDFNEYANGMWMKDNPIPNTEGRWTSFNVLAERNYDILRNICESAAADKLPGSARQKVGDFYRLAMDSVKLEADNFTPLNMDFVSIKMLTDNKAAVAYLGKMHKKGISGFFGFSVGQDVKKNDEHISYLSQSGLGLPDRDYYLKEDEKSKNIRNEYVLHITKMLSMTDYNAADAKLAAADNYGFGNGIGESINDPC